MDVNSEQFAELFKKQVPASGTAFSEYVVHTSSIPLASTLRPRGEDYFINTAEHHHGKERDDSCEHDKCMFAPREGPRLPEIVRDNCPCLKRNLIPLCFYSFLYKLGEDDRDDGKPRIDPSTVEFCQDGFTVFSEAYPRYLNETYSAKGWSTVSECSQLMGILSELYWFRYTSKSTALTLRRSCRERGVEQTKTLLKQAIWTIDGLLTKSFVLFRRFRSDYRETARNTGKIFDDLIHDYIVAEKSDDMRVYPSIKPWFEKIKSSSHQSDPQTRTEWLTSGSGSASLNSFFKTERRLYYQYIVDMWNRDFTDVTLSVGWINRFATMSQTGNLGHVPPAMEREANARYRKSIEEQEPRDITLEEFTTIKESFSKILPGKIRGVLSESVQQKDNTFVDRGKSKLSYEAISSIDIELKSASSVDSTRREGGKPEDARMLLRRAIQNGWLVPERDIYSGEIVDFFKVDEAEDASYHRYIFWISVHLAIHDLLNRAKKENRVRTKAWLEPLAGDPFMEEGKPVNDNLFIGEIVHIREPGKVRNLIKMKSILSWILSPAARITSSLQSSDPSHLQGLKGSSHAWKFMRRIDRDSGESGFVYQDDGGLRDNLWLFFQYWEKATDNIPKIVGLTIVEAFFNFTQFPLFYGDLVMALLSEPLEVFENYKDFDPGLGENAWFTWKGTIREGFPMGMQFVKNVLHMAHSYCEGRVRQALESARIDSEAGRDATKQPLVRFPGFRKLESIYRFNTDGSEDD